MTPGFIIRGNARAIAALAIGAGVTSVLYAWLAASSGSLMHWVIAVVLAAVAAVGAWLWADARTPLMVADEIGIRLRHGHTWIGLQWQAISSVTVRSQRGLHDGLIMIHPNDVARDIVAVPMTLTHLCTSPTPAEDLATLSSGLVLVHSDPVKAPTLESEVQSCVDDEDGSWLFDRLGA
ncbi:MAG: hypothetical protein V9E81_06995 [Marmoricola sp.]